MRRLQTKMVISFSVLILMASGILGYLIYRSSMQLVEHSLGAQAQRIAQSAAEQIDAVQYVQLQAGDQTSSYYWQLRERLNEVREVNGLKYLYTMGSQIRDGERQYYYMVDGAPADIAEDDFSASGTLEEMLYPGMVRAFSEQQPDVGELTYDDEYGAVITAYVPITDDGGEMIGLIGADFDAEHVYQWMARTKRLTRIIAVVAAAVGILLIYLLARYLTAPLLQLTGQIAKVKDGDLSVAVSVERKDEVGQLAASFRELVAGTRTAIVGIKSHSQQLLRASEEMSGYAQRTRESTRQIATNLNQASQGAEAQLERTHDMSLTLNGMAIGMGRIAQSVNEVTRIASQTREEGERGREQIAASILEMQEVDQFARDMSDNAAHLLRQSEQIGTITTMMGDLASRTALLALNASIEAAHAGEHGRGFAIVAEEVRKLADQSRTFAERIAILIDQTQQQAAHLAAESQSGAARIQAGMSMMNDAGTAFGEIVSGVEAVNRQLEEMSAASLTISSEAEGIASSADATERIARQAAQHFSEIAEHAAAQSETTAQLTRSADTLRQMSGELSELNKRFTV